MIDPQHGYDGALRAEVAREIERQDAKWGEQNHSDEICLLVLTEEVGEVAKAILERRAEFDTRPPDQMREEIVQVAAVAMQWLDCMDRRPEGGPRT